MGAPPARAWMTATRAGAEALLHASPVPRCRAGDAKGTDGEKGTEKQFRLGCRSCSAFIAYRSVAEAAPGKYLFVLPTAISERPPTRRGDEAQQRRRVLGDVD